MRKCNKFLCDFTLAKVIPSEGNGYKMECTTILKRYFIIIMIFTIILSGCSKEVENDQNLVVALEFGMTTLDPAFLRLLSEQYISCNLWEGLVRKNASGTIEPGIAKSWNMSPDALRYRFKLRKNALWSDGKPVTAYDFEYAWKRVLDPKRSSPVVFMMYFLKNGQAYNKNTAKREDVGVRAIDNYTLDVILEKPTPYFLEILNYHTYYPVRQDVIEKDPNLWHRKPYMLISNGPFYLEKWDYNKDIKVLKNSYYWDERNVKLNSITFMIDRIEPEETWATYLEGNIDYGYLFPSELNIYNELVHKGNNVFSENFPSTYYLCLNSKSKPLDNIKVRQAFELVIDKNRIVKERKKGEEVATGFIPPGIRDAEPATDFRSLGGEFMHTEFNIDNVQKAKTLLKEAGYSNMNDFPTIIILTRSTETVKYIKEDLEKNLGVKVQLDVCKDELYSQKRDAKEFDILASNWIADFADPINFLGFLASENAFKGLFPPEYYSMVEKSNTIADNKRRIDLLHGAEKTLLNSYTLIPVFFEKNAYYVKPYVKNIIKTPLAEIYFRNTYIKR